MAAAAENLPRQPRQRATKPGSHMTPSLEEAVMSEPVSESAPFPGNWEKYRNYVADAPSQFVLSHKLREAMGSQVHNPDQPELSGTVEIDGMYAGGNAKPANKKTDRIDRRLADEQTGKRQVVVVAREVMGRTMPFIVPRESDAVPLIRRHVASGSIVHADESNAWERLH